MEDGDGGLLGIAIFGPGLDFGVDFGLGFGGATIGFADKVAIAEGAKGGVAGFEVEAVRRWQGNYLGDFCGGMVVEEFADDALLIRAEAVDGTAAFEVMAEFAGEGACFFVGAKGVLLGRCRLEWTWIGLGSNWIRLGWTGFKFGSVSSNLVGLGSESVEVGWLFWVSC